jgi:Sulfotransferase domain
VALDAQEIAIVSGLPRSGTSMMMRMLDAGGMPVVSDGIRRADVDNPKGYYEFEQVKRIKEDASWIPSTRGKVFKMVSLLLYHLPAGERYRIVLMRRDTDEILASERKMLERLGKNANHASDERMADIFRKHLQHLEGWLDEQSHLSVLQVSYNDVVSEPRGPLERVAAFMGGGLDVEKMVGVVDPTLYRNRKV